MTPSGDSMDGASDFAPAVAVGAMIAPMVRVRVVGAAEIVVGRTKVRPDSAVLFALLFYLASRAGERIPRAEILELLWPGQPDAARRHSLRQIVYRIRRAGLECDVDGADLTIDVERVDSDINRIRSDAWVAESPMEDLPARGAILSGCTGTVSPAFGEWLESLRGEVNACVRRAALRQIAKARREGRWADLDSMARLCLSSDPLNEEATLALAEATAMSGSKAEALRILDAYLWEIGDKAREIGLPAKLLRRRISDQPQSRVPRVGDSALVGRAEELAWLNDRLEAVEPGSPRAVLLIGPPGIGKSALAKAFGAQVEMRGWRMFDARLQPSDTARPMSLFVELLPGLLKAEGAIGASPESISLIRQLLQHDDSDESMAERVREAPAFPARISAAILDLVGAVADEGPIVLLLDDLHWIDQHSLRALARLTESTSGISAFVVLSARTEGQFGTVREALSPDRVALKGIPPLATASIAQLLSTLAPEATRDSTPEVLQSALTLTGGNPLFVRGLAAHWNEHGTTDSLPADLRQLMRARVARLSPPALRVLHSCAMLGRYATVARLTRVLETNTSELLACIEELDALGVLGLKDEPGSLALHDLWAEELLAGLKPPTKALLHLRCGEVLESESLESRAVGLVHDAARHLIAAGTTARALRMLEDAANYQLANGFTEAAVETSREALRASESEDSDVRLRSLHVKALHAAGNWRAIVDLARDIGVTLREGGITTTHHTREELHCLEGLWRTGRAPEAALAAAISCAEAPGADEEHRSAACLLAAQAAANLTDTSALLRVKGILHAQRRAPPDQVPRSRIAASVVVEAEIGSLPRAVALADQLVTLERATGSSISVARALRFQFYPLRATGAWSQAIGVAKETYEIATRYQLHEVAANAAIGCATIHFEARQFEGVPEWLDRCESCSKHAAVKYIQSAIRHSRAELAMRDGDILTASNHLSELENQSEFASVRELGNILSLRTDVMAAHGNIAGLRQAADLLEQHLKRSRTMLFQDYIVVSLVRAWRALGRDAEASEYARSYVTTWRRVTSAVPDELVD